MMSDISMPNPDIVKLLNQLIKDAEDKLASDPEIQRAIDKIFNEPSYPGNIGIRALLDK